jgi:NADH-quinone oxidoreductase subunit L
LDFGLAIQNRKSQIQNHHNAMSIQSAIYIPWIPALAAVLCGVCCARRELRKFAGAICVLAIACSFALALSVAGSVKPFGPGGVQEHVVTAFAWMHVGNFHVDFAYFLDPLTVVMMMVVTGVGTLVAWYATGYMKGDRGYARFFAGVSLFIFAMLSLVMADNLVLLYLGWEGVGLCSYLLIGYYYDKPAAVAAAKKAFIVNRIGDLGFALGIWLTYTTFDTVSLHAVVTQAQALLAGSGHHELPAAVTYIPFLLMLGAFGKSAQIPLYVWLPDAMEGPTPVSALIHAATMVTAGVYMIARLLPVFTLSPYALPTVAFVGGLTALFAATIALCQYDIKRIYAYSTISQLGYMFLGVGALSAFGGVFHLFTHAFFKALLFLTAGSVMHALAGQLDLRKMSGLRRKMPVTCWLMFIGCLALAGVPPFAGFFSKDTILAAALEKGLGGEGGHGSPLFLTLAIMGLFTAFLTAFYTFRLWFRVFMGPERYEMGAEHGHAPAPAPGSDEHEHGHASDTGTKIEHEHHHAPHEMPLLGMNVPLMVLALGAILAGILGESWMHQMIDQSTAAGVAAVSVAAEHGGQAAAAHGETAGHHGPTILGLSLHVFMMVVSSAVAAAGIALAAYFHWLNRSAADAVAGKFSALVSLLNHKYYIDEINHAVIVMPLRGLGHLCFILDTMLVGGLVSLVALVPRLIGVSVRPAQNGRLQGYGLGMMAGVAAVVVLLVWAL